MICSLCGRAELVDRPGRPAAWCPSCYSLERHRALAREFAARLADGAGRSSLEAGPVSEYVFGGWLRERGWAYQSFDRSFSGNEQNRRDVGFIDFEGDLTNLVQIATESVDLVIVQHVIEEIPDYGAALDEIARVLRPGGTALLEIPHDLDRDRSEPKDPDRFGNVWLFGRDLEDELHRRFTHVERHELVESAYHTYVFACDITPRVRAEASSEHAEKVAAAWNAPGTNAIRSFWQSKVVLAEINRRITGDPEVDPPEFFRDRFCPTPLDSALSLGSGGGQLEIRLAELGACRRLLGVDVADERVRGANERRPTDLVDRVRFEVRDLERWQPEESYDLVVAQDVLHHIDALEKWCELISALLTPDGLVYVHDFIGPARFQWTDRQVDIVNRLLDALPDRLRRDLVDGDGRLRAPVARPSAEAMIRSDPSEAIRPQEIPRLLETYLEPVIVKPYGGAIFHQFFNRIMGNFAEDPDLIRLLMEFDFVLTDLGAVQADYLWGVYRKRAS
jgi:SAM-dependent methyltransferase